MKFPKTTRIKSKPKLAAIRNELCFVCGHAGTPFNPITASHIQTRGSGGGDEDWNVVPMHLVEHRQWEDDRYSFSIARPVFMGKLKALGWEFVELFGVFKLRRKE